jgi:glycerophosphoryl diester phosphodiesterase
MFRHLISYAVNALFLLPLLPYSPIMSADSTVNKPFILAHRGGSGLWIQNSRFAVEQTVELYKQNPQKLHGIEVDIVLTKDNIPVIAHDPWVHTRLCHPLGGSTQPLERMLIKDLYFEELQQRFICGGKPDEDFPDAKTRAESILGFEEFLSLVAETPDLIIYLDSKLQAPITQPAEDYAKAIFHFWESTDIRNPLYIEAPDKASLAMYQQYANTPFTAVLSSPPFFADSHWWLTGFTALLNDFIFAESPLRQAQAAKADAVAVPFRVLNTRSQAYLQQANKQVIVFTLNDHKTIQQACNMAVDIIITDFPNVEMC